jgi:hypothetical protein
MGRNPLEDAAEVANKERFLHLALADWQLGHSQNYNGQGRASFDLSKAIRHRKVKDSEVCEARHQKHYICYCSMLRSSRIFLRLTTTFS